VTRPSIFEQNRHLSNDLPAVGARAIEYWAKAGYGARLILMIVQQTYGGFLNFHPHLHCLVYAGGLEEGCVRWIRDLHFEKTEHKHELMLAWRFALIAYLHAATGAEVVKSDLSADELRHVLEVERQRNWNIFVGRSVPKRTVIRHIGRYIRKPPIAQYRLTRLSDGTVQYLAKNTRKRCLTPVTYTNQEFLALLMPHVPDRYCNAMHYFGLLAPRCKRLLTVLFELLNQSPKPRPARLSWARSLDQTFGRNPLIGSDGSVLRRIGRLDPVSAR
jgi:hypothetical protein